MNKLYTKFDLSYKKFLKNYLKKTNNISKNSSRIFECNFSPINPMYYFSKYVSNIIVEDYNIFPVPKKLLDSIENFALSSEINKNDFIEQRYDFKDILNYVEDWDYYSEFKINMELLLKEKSNCSIICCAFNSREGVKKILSKYPVKNISVDDISDSFAFIYTYNEDNEFNACLIINANGNKHKIRKVVQHELIHWMQVSLNSHTHKTHGLFNDKKFNLTNNQYDKLRMLIGVNDIQFKNYFEYLFNSREFEAWVANTCEEFEDSDISLEKFKDIVKNEDTFTDKFIKSDNDKREMWLFGRLCYLTSQNDQSDDRWWYLLEALKENVEQNEKLK